MTMPPTSPDAPGSREKSTNVRTDARPLWQAIRRTGLQGFAALAPGPCERWAISRFATPTRPRPAAAPDPGLPPLRFQVPVDGVPGADPQVVAWRWGQGPSVLLVHGWSGYAAQMTGFVAPLVQAGYQVVAFDHPAHGQSPGRRTSMLEFRQAVLALGRRLGPLHGVIAHSLGATATLLALDRGLAVQRAVLVAPPLDPFPFARAFAAHVGLPRARSEGMVERLRRFLRADLGDRFPVEAAADVRAPLLIIHDRDDRAVPLAHGQRLAGVAPAATLLTVDGLGHRRVLSNRAVIDSAVDFVRTGARPRPVDPAGTSPPPARVASGG